MRVIFLQCFFNEFSVCLEPSFIENSLLMSSRTKSLSRFLLSLSIYWSTLSSVAEFFIKLLSSESSSSGLILASAYCSRGFLDEKEELRAKSLILTCSSKSSLVSDSKISSISGRVCLKK